MGHGHPVTSASAFNPTAAPETEASTPEPDMLAARTLFGNDVYSQDDEDLGNIWDVMLDMHSGRAIYAVLSFGGFLDMGDKLFAVPWEILAFDAKNRRFVLNVEKEHLKEAPSFYKDRWPDMADPSWAEAIHSYYGTRSRSGQAHLW